MVGNNKCAYKIPYTKNSNDALGLASKGSVSVIKKQVAVIGAGASGLFFGYSFVKENHDLVIIDHMNGPGKKLRLCGGGQCNLTHAGSIKDFLPMYYEKGKAIRKLLYKYSNQLMMDDLQKNGLPLVCRQDGKVFPKAMSSDAVINFLVAAIQRGGGQLVYDQQLTDITVMDSSCLSKGHNNNSSFRYCLSFQSGMEVHCNFIVLGCGGRTFTQTGSDASILNVLSMYNQIKFTKCRQGLAPIYTDQFPFKDLAGVVIDPVTCQVLDKEGRVLGTETGPLLFNGRCFSGPCILHLSRFARDGYTLKINYLSATRVKDPSSWAKTAAMEMNQSKKSLASFGQDKYKLPRSFLKIMEMLFPTPSQFATNLVSHKLTITNANNFKTGMITCGGIDLDCLNLNTMEIKGMDGVYAIGELVDVDGKSGGYNLQWAFSSGFAAANSINSVLSKL